MIKIIDNIDLLSSDFQNEFYRWYPSFYKDDVYYFQKSNCYGVFKFEMVKSILNNAEYFSSRHLNKVDKILVGADNEVHTINKKIIFSSLSMLKNYENDNDLIDQILDVLFSELKYLPDVKINIIDWLVNPFVFTYTAIKLGIIANIDELNILISEGSLSDKINRIKHVFENLNLIEGIASNSVKTDCISQELNEIRVLINEREEYSEEDFIQFLKLLVLAGIETTSSFIGSAIYLLHNKVNISQKKSIQSDEGDRMKFFNEVLRYFSPAQFTYRVADKDYFIGTDKIPKDSIMAVSVGAANRDPNYFMNANVFNMDRDEKHIAFGISKHKCIGEKLAIYLANKFFTKYLAHETEYKYENFYTVKNSPFSFKIDEFKMEI